MLKRILISLMAYLMAFYPIFGSLANAGSQEPAPAGFKQGSEVMSQKSEAENQATVDESTKVKLQETYGKLPLSFIQNNGQADEKVKFYEKGSGHSTFFTKEGVYLSLVRSQDVEQGFSPANVVTQFIGHKDADKSADYKPKTPNLQSENVKLTPINANKNPQIIAENKQEGKVNYFIGNDPSKWKTNIPTYQAILYKDIYKNIDMKFYGNNSQMEYDIIVKPGADPKMVKLSYEGIEGLKVTDDGDLLISLKEGKLIQKKPIVYQEINGKRIEVDGRFKILNQSQDPSLQSPVAYGFQVSSYNKNHPLIIDPVLAYSTYLGGSGDDADWGHGGIAVDISGNAYMTGYTQSTDFPLASPLQGSNAGGPDVFVTKLNSSGSSLVYSTYLGGSYGDYGYGIAVDPSGNAYITGYTGSTNFPTASAIQGSNAGGYDVFVTKINSSGSALIYSTYLGGSGSDDGQDIVVDTSGNAYIIGQTWSTNFPIVSAYQGSNAGAPDAFVTKINSSGNALVYSTYLGGGHWDYGKGIAVDNSGNAYMTGHTYSTDFPLSSPIQGSNAGGDDVYVTKISPAVSGCIQLNGSSVTGASVLLKQKREADQSTTTNTSGCYHFDNAVSGKTFQVIINGPTVP